MYKINVSLNLSIRRKIRIHIELSSSYDQLNKLKDVNVKRPG